MNRILPSLFLSMLASLIVGCNQHEVLPVTAPAFDDVAVTITSTMPPVDLVHTTPTPMSYELTLNPLAGTWTAEPDFEIPGFHVVPTVDATSMPLVPSRGALPALALTRLGIGQILASDVSPDRSLLALGTSTGIYVFDLDDFSIVWRRYTPYSVMKVEWSSDSDRLLSHYDNLRHAPAIWDGRSGEKIANLEGWKAAWSPDGSLIVVSTITGRAVLDRGYEEDVPGEVTIFNGYTGQSLHRLTPVEGAKGFWVASDLGWITDDKVAAFVSDGQIYLWDHSVPTLEGTIDIDGEFKIQNWRRVVDISPDHRYVGAWSYIEAYIWDAQTQQPIFGYTREEEQHVEDVTWLPGTNLVAVSVDEYLSDPERLVGKTLIFDLTTGALINTIDAWGAVMVAAPDGSKIALLPSNGSASIYDVITGRLVDEIPLPPNPYFYSPVGNLEWVTTDELLVITEEKVIRWQANTAIGFTGFETPGGILDIQWSADSQTLGVQTSTGKQYWDRNTNSWSDSVADTEDQYPFLNNNRPFEVISVDSPDAALTLTTQSAGACGDGRYGGGCHLFDGHFVVERTMDNGDQVVTAERYYEGENNFPSTGITTVAWSLSSHMLAIGLGNTGGFEVYDFFPANAYGNQIEVIDPYTGEQLFWLDGHNGNIIALVFSPDGTLLASVSADATVMIWNLARNN